MPSPTITVTGKCSLGHDWSVVFDDNGVTKKLGGTGQHVFNVETGGTTEIYCKSCSNEAHKAAKYHGWEE